MNNSPRKKCIFVLGMHRSGTSALTGVLNLLGVNLGINLLIPTGDNEKGYFENRNILTANEKILKTLDSAWDSVFPLPENWWKEASLTTYKNELKEIIQTEFSGELIAIKDPRICKLLPLWKEILADLGIDYCSVIPLRNPLEVARSLQKRNGFSVEKSAILWATHTFDAELLSRDCPRVFLSFDNLLTDTQNTITILADVLNLNFPKPLMDSLATIKEFLEPNLKHYSQDSKENNQDLLNDISQWYQLLLGLTLQQTTKTDEIAKIDAIKNRFMYFYRYFYNNDVIQQYQDNERQISDQNLQLAEKEKQLIEKEWQLAENGRRLQAILNSKSWKITSLLRKIRAVLIPRGSKRVKIIKIIIKDLIFPFYVIKKIVSYLKYYGLRQFIKKILEKSMISRKDFNCQHQIFVPQLKILETETKDLKEYTDADISIIIPTKNAGPEFDNLLSMLRKQAGFQSVEIIIVDSGSTDDTLKIAEINETKIIKIAPEEFSHSYARNLGAQQAIGKYLLFMTQDAFPSSTFWLYQIFYVLKNNDVVAASCAEFMREDADLLYRVLTWNHHRFLGIESQDQIMSMPKNTDGVSLRKNAQLSDVTCLIKKDVFTQYWYRYNYAEDLDLGVRLIRDNYKLALLRSVATIHSHNKPAYYYLKRWYVETLSLAKILPNQTITKFKFDSLLNEIVTTYHLIHEILNGVSAGITTPYKATEFVDLVNQCMQNPSNSTNLTSFTINENYYIDEEFKQFLNDILNICQTNQCSTAYPVFLARPFNSFAKLILEYIKNTYTEIDQKLSEEFKRCVYKAFALIVGDALACCYLIENEQAGENLIQIHNQLSKGI